MFRVRNLTTREIVPGIPSPLLIQTGRGDAYDAGSPAQGFWRLRDDKYDPAGTVYTRVAIEHTDDWKVEVVIHVTEPGREPYRYEDYFIVQAMDRAEAERLTYAKAHEDIIYRFGEESGSDVQIIRAREGVSI